MTTYYHLYPKQSTTYSEACKILKQAGIYPMPTHDQYFYHDSELTTDQVSQLDPYFTIKKRCTTQDKKDKLDRDLRAFRQTEEWNNEFSRLCNIHGRDKSKVHDGLITFLKKVRPELVQSYIDWLKF